MNTRIEITGAQPYDGRYEFDWNIELTTTREWGWIKRHAGYLPATLLSDLGNLDDPEFVCVLAAIAMHRTGRIQTSEIANVIERLADAPFGPGITVEIEPDPEETDDSSPPPRSSNSNGATSGAASPTSSATPATTPSPTGMFASATSASAPPTSGT